MKKIGLFIFILIFIISGISYMFLNYVANNKIAQKENEEYQSYYEKEIIGAELATLINKVVDSNIKNKIKINNKNEFIDDNENSINIVIKFIDNDKKYNMKKIYDTGTDNFMRFYNQIIFKCIKIEYHDKSKKIKYMYFEQVLN